MGAARWRYRVQLVVGGFGGWGFGAIGVLEHWQRSFGAIGKQWLCGGAVG